MAIPQGGWVNERFLALVLGAGLWGLRVPSVHPGGSSAADGQPRVGCARQVFAARSFGYALVVRLHLAAEIVAWGKTGVVIKIATFAAWQNNMIL